MGYYMGDMGATKASTRLVNETEKVIHLYVESAGENYFFKRTLKAREAFVEEFDANSTYRKMRVFVLEPGGSNRLTDLSISSDDMLDSQQIAVAQLADGRLVLLFTPRSGLICRRPHLLFSSSKACLLGLHSWFEEVDFCKWPHL
ncbi:hypothetical protein KC19_10G007500 [Ceratodon purpureus]|uniref:DUF7748 domain-containing protein n=1 Tax=Ceratodon purpureus TaxID=3225 RepID=A0A8T0GGK2_CERPU|nr:hypothetical protein KC19_10G007500 [Ceratodon purpureus]